MKVVNARTSIMGMIAAFALSTSVPVSSGNTRASVDAGNSGFSIVRTIKIPDGLWDYVSIDAPSRKLLLGREDGVMVMNLDDEIIVSKFVPGLMVHAVVLLPDGLAANTNGLSNTVNIFDLATGALKANVPTGLHPDAAVYEASTGLLFAMDMEGGDVTVIDPHKGASVGRIVIGGRLEFAATDDHGKVYVNVASRSTIAVIDAATRRVVAKYKLPQCVEPSGLAIDPENHLLVVACNNRKALVADANDGRIVAQLATGEGADAVIFDASHKRFFIPCGESGSLVVVEEKRGFSPAVSAVVKTALGARTGALDAKTGKLYLPAADYTKEMITVSHRTFPKPVSGSIRLLVVDASSP
jgi:DNA-binding beta-propeller fold protein YncE